MKRRHRRLVALQRERDRLLTRGRIVAAVIIAMVAVAFTISIVYYNRLTRSEQDVYKELAKIDTLLQRRRNISINLARTVRDYAVHEQGIFNHVSNMRRSPARRRPGEVTTKPAGENVGALSSGSHSETGATAAPKAAEAMAEVPVDASLGESAASGNSLVDNLLSMLEGGAAKIPFDEKLAGLLAVAENYPDLKLSENFRSFMSALIETEKDLSDRRMAYSDVVNNYTTQLKTFPGRMFALVYGFDPFSYFSADDEAKRFRPVEY